MKSLIDYFKRIVKSVGGVETSVNEGNPVTEKENGCCSVTEPRPWTKEDEDYLISNYANTKDAVLAFLLNRSKYSIVSKARKLGLKKSKEFFYECGNGEETVEVKLAKIMDMQKDFGEFSVDLYYNRLTPREERCVARYTDNETKRVYHARCKNYTEALDRMHEYVSVILKR